MFSLKIWEYWCKRVDKSWRPSPKVQLGAFNGQRQGWKTQEDLLVVHCFREFSGSALVGDLGVSRSEEREILSVLS